MKHKWASTLGDPDRHLNLAEVRCMRCGMEAYGRGVNRTYRNPATGEFVYHRRVRHLKLNDCPGKKPAKEV